MTRAASPESRPHVVVVGGGIAGLAAALRLAEQPVQVTLLEQSPRLGGKLARAEVGGVTVDVGAEAMLHRRPEGADLVARLGLAEDLVHPATSAARLWSRDRLVSMPRTLLGVPGDTGALAEVLSSEGVARAAREPVLPPLQPGEDVTVGELVEARFGPEVVDRLVEPLLGGVYAGHARALSLRATMPQVAALAEQGGSLSARVATSLAQAVGSTQPVFAGVRGGLGRLPEAARLVLERSGATVRTEAVVRSLSRDHDGWEVIVGSTRAPESVRCAAVVLATPAAPTARLLQAVAPDAAGELTTVDYASTAIVTLAVAGLDPRELTDRSGSGFLVPPVDGHGIKAATLSFAKWDWVREAGAGTLVLRASVGRHREEASLQRPDEELVALATREVSQALGRDLPVRDSHVQRWGGALPQYAVGHLDRVDRIRRQVATVPGLAVCGAAYDGVGIPACVASAHRAAEDILRGLRVGAAERMEP